MRRGLLWEWESGQDTLLVQLLSAAMATMDFTLTHALLTGITGLAISPAACSSVRARGSVVDSTDAPALSVGPDSGLVSERGPDSAVAASWDAGQLAADSTAALLAEAEAASTVVAASMAGAVFTAADTDKSPH
jgi:hypothetical protein